VAKAATIEIYPPGRNRAYYTFKLRWDEGHTASFRVTGWRRVQNGVLFPEVFDQVTVVLLISDRGYEW